MSVDSHAASLASIRKFLLETTCYSILPESFRLIVLDNELTVKRALAALTMNAVASAPLYDTLAFKFAGMLTYTDFIHLIQYYYLTALNYDNAAADVEQMPLSSLREIEKSIGVPPPPTIKVHPDNPLLDASAALARTHARRIPLVDKDDSTGKETILSVLTQYRLLKFIAINCAQDCLKLTTSIGELGIGTYTSSYQLASGGSVPPVQDNQRRPRSRSVVTTSKHSSAESSPAPTPPNASNANSPAVHTVPPPSINSNNESINNSSSKEDISPIEQNDRFHPLATATLKTTVFDVVHLFSELGISGVPIINPDTGEVINLYESIDVVDLIKDDSYHILDLTIEQALSRRQPTFAGVMICSPEDSLSNIMSLIRERRVHRMVIVESNTSRLVGMLTLSDIVSHLVGQVDLQPVQLRGLGLSDEPEIVSKEAREAM